LNVAVFRMHCNSWDIEVDQGQGCVARFRVTRS
jgi:hypothetical protein